MPSINQANPAVVTLDNSLANGNFIILYNTTGMTQIAGMTFTASSVAADQFTLLGLDTSGFAEAATDVSLTVVSNVLPVQPEFRYVTKITRGLTTIVQFSCTHSYIVDQLLRLSIPKSFGMPEMDGKTGKILSVTDYTVTLDINSQNFNPFSFPATTPRIVKTQSPLTYFNSLYTTQLFATASPAGARNEYNISTIPFHQTQGVLV